MKRLFVFITIILGFTMLFVACQTREEDETEPQVYTYELGKNEITEYGDSFSFQTKGIMAFPEGQELPILLILHGAYQNNDIQLEAYNNKFTDLVKAFAEKGFFTIAIDLSDAYIGDDLKQQMYYVKGILVTHFKALVNADMGKQVFEVDLRNKLDFKKLSVLGHERGTEAALYFADDLVRQNIYIKSLVMVDTSSDYEAQEIYYDVPTAAIVTNKDQIPPNVEELYQLSKADKDSKYPFYIVSINQKGNKCLTYDNLDLIIDCTYSFVNASLQPNKEADMWSDRKWLEEKGIEIVKE